MRDQDHDSYSLEKPEKYPMIDRDCRVVAGLYCSRYQLALHKYNMFRPFDGVVKESTFYTLIHVYSDAIRLGKQDLRNSASKFPSPVAIHGHRCEESKLNKTSEIH